MKFVIVKATVIHQHIHLDLHERKQEETSLNATQRSLNEQFEK